MSDGFVVAIGMSLLVRAACAAYDADCHNSPSQRGVSIAKGCSQSTLEVIEKRFSLEVLEVTFPLRLTFKFNYRKNVYLYIDNGI